MFKKLIIVALFVFAYLGFSLYPKHLTTVESQTLIAAETDESAGNLADLEFPATQKDYAAPKWWKGKVFAIRTDYPTVKPPACAVGDCLWKKFDFTTDPEKYLKAVLDYAVEGNIEADWVVQNNKIRNWYHAPYMHLGNTGREFIHGMTRERSACLDELVEGRPCSVDCHKHRDHPKCFQTWAVSVYNEPGAYHIGKVWNEVAKSTARNRGVIADGFPVDTVAVKLLFTNASSEKGVPYLKNALEWQADTTRINKTYQTADNTKKQKIKAGCRSQKDCFETLRLLQVDVAVRDDRSPIGWVFGTFIYNKNSTKKYPLGVEPVGLMFGNGVQPSESESRLINIPGIPQHYGCPQGDKPELRRLNGPVDNPESSCTSCHSLAEMPAEPKSLADLTIAPMPYDCMNCGQSKWYRNINPRSKDTNLVPRTFDEEKDMVSLDYSLQLREGIMRYYDELKAKNAAPK